MATAVKTAGFIALARVLYTSFQASLLVWQPILFGLAVATMVLGNLVALAQKSLKRMLAYSSVAHAGQPARGPVALGQPPRHLGPHLLPCAGTA